MTTAGIHEAGTRGGPTGHRWVVVDTETSGMQASSHRVLSVAALVLREDGSVEREFSTLLNPGCDPGPVHVHGLTPDRLSGAPRFEDVADEFTALLSGRTMVAHNASFDHRFLDAEFQRIGTASPIESRLCTLALSRRLELDVPNHKLATLADYWHVPQFHAHDACDDARVLTEIFTRSVSLAESLQLPLPVVDCTGRRTAVYPDRVPRVPSQFRNPGRFDPAVGLVQGTTVVVSGATRTPRLTLAARLSDAGFDVVNSVSRRTGVVVCNDPTSPSTKVRRAIADGIPIVSETELDRLLAAVVPGTPKVARPAVTVTAVSEDAAVPEAVVAPVVASPPPGPAPRGAAWRGRRVLLMGGTHLECVMMRSRIVQLGARPSLNLTAAVTDVLVLSGGEGDRRMPRVEERGLPLLRESDVNDAVTSGFVPAHMRHESRVAAPLLMRGQTVDLPAAPSSWAVNVAWRADAEFDVDVVAFLLGDDRRVDADRDFVFYNNPTDADEAVELSVDGGSEQSIRVDVSALPDDCHRVVIAAAIDGGHTFGDLGGVSVGVDGPDHTFATFVLDAGTVERTMILTEIYRRHGVWRVRAVGQGHDDDLAALATGYGVEIDGD